MNIKNNEVIFLIGAGCSYDANIPTTTRMITEIEDDLLKNKWNDLKDLYFYVKSAILYGEGIFGNFNNTFSIEKFVNVLRELEKRDRNVVYPFIANWNNRLIELSGDNFKEISRLNELITKQLVKWIMLDDYSVADYYKRFYSFQEEVGHPLRVFSLNYDLCFEYSKSRVGALELGFDSNKKWNSERFSPDHQEVDAGIYLYKLHGSITWKRDKENGNILKASEHPVDEPDLIFGTDAKLQSIDPYLFFVYEFRKYSLMCNLIVIVGYSFGDHYINGLIKQALDNNKDRVLLVVDVRDTTKVQNEIVVALNLKNALQINVTSKKAKEFLESELNAENIAKFIKSSDDQVFN